MTNPYEIPLLVIGVLAGLAAGFVFARCTGSWRWSLAIVLVGTGISWVLFIQSVQWTYAHPFDPDDGGPLSFAAMFGGARALAWPILPAFLAALVATRVLRRRGNGPRQGE